MISIRIVKPEIYDIFEEVFGLMITVKNESIKKLTREIVLNFIQNYPLSEQLLEKIILKLVNNLEFDQYDGRITVLTVIDKLIGKLPLEAVKTQLEVIVLGLVTRLVNENVKPAVALTLEVTKNILTKIHEDPEYTSFMAKMFSNCQLWMKDHNPGTKRAGLQMLQLLYWVTGEYHKVEKAVTDMIEDLEVITNQIVEFWEEMKSNEALKETLKENLWRDVYWDEDVIPRDDTLSIVKDSKTLVIDYISFIEIILCSPKSKHETASTLTELLLKLSRHPDEDVQIKVLEVLSKLLQQSSSKKLAKEHLKSILITLFAALKSKHLTEDITPLVTELFKLVLEYFQSDIPKLRGMIVTAISNINFKYLRFGHRFMSIVNKCLAVARTVVSVLPQDLPQEDLEELLSFFVRMEENGFVRQDKEALERLEMDIERVRNYATDEDNFMMALTRVRGQVNTKKVEYRTDKKMMAVNDPEQFAKLKRLDTERRKKRRKEKQGERRFGSVKKTKMK